MAVDVLVPPLGTTVDTLTLISWYKQEGETVTKDEPLFVVETDKATLDVESPASGILCRVCAQPGAEVVALSRIATIRAPAEVMQSETIALQPATGLPGEVLSMASSASPSPVLARQAGGGRIFISPRAKGLADARQLDWRGLTGTGPEGAIVERDVLSRLASARPKPVTPVAQKMAESAGVDWKQLSGSGPGGKVVREDVNQALTARIAFQAQALSEDRDDDAALESLPLSGVRAVISARMMESALATAPVTLTTETDATALVELRSKLAEDGLAISYNALLLRVLARALQEHPRMNASLQGEAIKVWRDVHIGLAVDSEQGLRVPVLRSVDRKDLVEIEIEIQSLVEAARQGQTGPEQMRGGTFTLTNLGMYGIDAFTPVINLPECAILGVGRIKPQASVVDDQVVVRKTMWLSLTFDHRLVDGGPAARFLQRVAQLIEKPHLLLT